MRFDSLYVVLGFLDEYAGRLINEDDDRVEHFYSNEKGSEVFEHYLLKAARERGIKEEPETQWTDGGSVTYRSRELAELINSMYSYELKGGFSRAPLDEHGCPDYDNSVPVLRAEAMVSAEMFASVGREEKLSFLAGVHTRYGEGIGQMRFGNAEHKARLTMELLEELGCRKIELETIRNVPNVNIIRFEASGEVGEAFVEFEALTAREMGA